ncbi:MAG TPA: succinylglutamate desuccinylase/aspartoacylase family protein [Gaiellaceae bacterium]|nr:succinylglutamate desuccinylase/aspartoacylase family protein [Gaiellaceae bacterium]
MTGSPITCTLDLDEAGKHSGHLQLPRSSNQSGWSTQWIPITSVANGEGPTALVIGGVHGDEPEGQVAALNLARELRPEQVSGRVIVIPCLSLEASRAYTRLWPSGANLNRSFPGSPTGPPDEQLAHFVSSVLFPLADIVVDIHSGGRTGLCLPWSEMHWVEDVAQRRSMVEGMLAWNTDWCCVYIDIAGTGLLVGEAEQQGKIVVSTELGGGGHVTAAIHRLARSGLANVLRHYGVVEGEVETRESLGLPPQVFLMATDADNYLLAPVSGVFETLVDLGQRVSEGEVVGRIHSLERPEAEPMEVAARNDGIVCAVRAIATTEQGDNVVVIAREVDRSELE